MRRSSTIRPGDHSQGFTLIELVAIVLILAVLTAAAIPTYIDMRRESRIAALHRIAAATMAANDSAIDAYRARGVNPVTIGGVSVAVLMSHEDSWGQPIPEGSPDAVSLYRMLGCGSTAPVIYVYTSCESLPNHSVQTYGNADMFIHTTGTANCFIEWWPGYGHAPSWPSGPTTHRGYAFDFSGC
jgi:type II secretory pathway pseudopilin PulG